MLSADMPSLFAGLDQGGRTDPQKCFYTHCFQKLNNRPKLFGMITTPAEISLCEPADQYDMFPETLLALNGYDGQFQRVEKFGTSFEDSTLIDDPNEVHDPLASADRGEVDFEECSEGENCPGARESKSGPGSIPSPQL